MLEIRLFGSPRIRRDDVEIRFDTRKAVALVALLAVHGREQSRDTLAAMLWPELDRQRARATLRRTLSVTAAGLPEVTADQQAVRLDLDAVRCDVTEFRRFAGGDGPADWALAADRIGDAFLSGFSLRDSPAFDDWQLATADALRDEASTTLALLVDDAVVRGDLAAALGYARRRSQVDPLSEPAQADLIRITAWSGDRPGALQAYRGLVRLLDRELGVAPLPETLVLHDAIRAGTLLPPPTPVTPGLRVAATREAAVPSIEPADPGLSSEAEDVARVAVAVGARLEATAEVTLQIVAAAAVVAIPADQDLLRTVAGRDDAETADAIEEAVGLGLLVESDGPRVYEVPHALVRGAILGQLPLARRRILHGRAGEALARRAAVDPESVAPDIIARQFADAGRDAEAGDWYAIAAEAATRRSASLEALDAWRSALAVGRDGVEVHTALAAALVRLGRYDEALAALDLAAGSAADDDEALAAIRHTVAGVHDRLGEWSLAEEQLVAARTLVAGPRHARILADLALVQHRQGRDADAEAAARAAERAAAEARDVAALAQAGNVLGVLAAGRGDHVQARVALESAVALARDVDTDLLIAALNNLSRVIAASGDLEAGLDVAREALDLAERQGDRHRLAALHSHLADLLHASGREAEAIVELKSSAAAFAEVYGAEVRPEVWTLTEW